MNPPKYADIDYINFLVGAQKSYSCLEAEKVQPQAEDSPAHDSITRLLHRDEPRHWQTVARIEKSGNESGILVIYPAPVNIALVFWAIIAYNVDKLCLWI